MSKRTNSICRLCKTDHTDSRDREACRDKWFANKKLTDLSPVKIDGNWIWFVDFEGFTCMQSAPATLQLDSHPGGTDDTEAVDVSKSAFSFEELITFAGKVSRAFGRPVIEITNSIRG